MNKIQYGQAKRFDEGELFQSEQYLNVVKQRKWLEEAAENIYGKGIKLLFNEYADIWSDLIELECQHYFEEGHRTAL